MTLSALFTLRSAWLSSEILRMFAPPLPMIAGILSPTSTDKTTRRASTSCSAERISWTFSCAASTCSSVPTKRQRELLSATFRRQPVASSMLWIILPSLPITRRTYLPRSRDGISLGEGSAASTSSPSGPADMSTAGAALDVARAGAEAGGAGRGLDLLPFFLPTVTQASSFSDASVTARKSTSSSLSTLAPASAAPDAFFFRRRLFLALSPLPSSGPGEVTAPSGPFPEVPEASKTGGAVSTATAAEGADATGATGAAVDLLFFLPFELFFFGGGALDPTAARGG
mmetsp:Transcript_5202/g.15266  ORF Transcript_5202/g.15266 Transcript_5202/m.15266 type:complete len:286 (-) Transcript_5202:183-1040(-)